MVDPVTNGEKRTAQKTTFRVKIWDVHGSLNTPERPVVVKFNVDGGKYKAATNVVRNTRQPHWMFPTSGEDARAKAGNDSPTVDENLRKDIKFLYHTKAPKRLTQKMLVVSLCERNKRGAETEWGKAAVSLDALAKGCERIKLSMIGRGNYGYVQFRSSMSEIRKVEAILSDLKIVNYPERHRHEVKMIFFEFGYLQFGDGYKLRTEKSSEGEPDFKKLPVLTNTCSLSEMILGNQNGTQLQVFFSFHRQVSRERTEQIGIGALPIKLIFQKKRMVSSSEVRTKFKVPLADYKGTIRGRILLRNLPAHAQLRGNDLIYEDGFFLPRNVDLRNHLLLPWLPLPSEVRQSPGVHSVPAGTSPTQSPQAPTIAAPVMSAPLQNGTHSPPVNGHYSPTNSSSPDSSLGHLAVSGGYAASSYPQYVNPREGQATFAYGPHNVIDSPPRTHGSSGEWVETTYGRSTGIPSPRNIGSTAPLSDRAPAYLPNASLSDEGSAHTSSDGLSNLPYPYSRGPEEGASMANVDRRQDEWVPVRLPNSDCYYFANQRTTESLWLPPRWERLEDEHGRQFFVDHNTQTTQFEFPAVEARLYREQAKGSR